MARPNEMELLRPSEAREPGKLIQADSRDRNVLAVLVLIGSRAGERLALVSAERLAPLLPAFDARRTIPAALPAPQKRGSRLADLAPLGAAIAVAIASAAALAWSIAGPERAAEAPAPARPQVIIPLPEAERAGDPPGPAAVAPKAAIPAEPPASATAQAAAALPERTPESARTAAGPQEGSSAEPNPLLALAALQEAIERSVGSGIAEPWSVGSQNGFVVPGEPQLVDGRLCRRFVLWVQHQEARGPSFDTLRCLGSSGRWENARAVAAGGGI